MALQVVTFMSTLMRLSAELGRARQSGDQARIDEAQARHDSYAALCLQDDVEISMEPFNDFQDR